MAMLALQASADAAVSRSDQREEARQLVDFANPALYPALCRPSADAGDASSIAQFCDPDSIISVSQANR